VPTTIFLALVITDPKVQEKLFLIVPEKMLVWSKEIKKLDYRGIFERFHSEPSSSYQ
jgi:hypothetical protein